MDFFYIWKNRKEAIHRHNVVSQNQAHHHCLRAKMELLHSKHGKVIAVDSNLFIGETPAAL
jgi:hypothetical protein